MKVAVVGSHTFEDYNLLKSALDNVDVSEVIISKATRANQLAQWYAVEQNIPYQVFSSLSPGQQKSAIADLNQQLIDACDLVVAFWDGKSKETMKAIDYAKSQNKAVEINYFNR